MADPTIICPKCGTEIKLTESLAAPLVAATRRELEEKIARNNSEVARREAAIKEKEAAVLAARTSIDEQVAAKLESQRTAIAAEEAKKAKLLLSNELKQKADEITNLQAVMKERDAKLAEAQKAQADLIRKERELADAKREMELNIEKQVQASLGQVRDKARKEAEDSLKLSLTEKEHTITSMQKTIEELKQKAQQGSQQLQGEVQELELESTLRAKFPRDTIEPVPKGEFGGDIMQRVFSSGGQACGTILWEAKRTKNWSDGWLAKLRDDQRAAKAELAVIVSKVLPNGVETFDFIGGVWVTSTACALPVAMALRQSLMDLAAARQTGDGQQTKMGMVYGYLTGPHFRQRVGAIVEAFTSMQDDLNAEKKAITKQWAKRESQIERVMQATVGMYGDLQGIAGKSLKEIEGLDMKMLAGDGQQD
ncbi:MAG: DUF2130 domain-containing protein [Phycisphaerae bacterium]